MKSILLSIKPKYVEKILNGYKTIEVRKRFPKDYKGWVYIYCTKEDSLCRLKDYPKDRYVCEQAFECDDFPKLDSGYDGKCKVVARFYCDKVEGIDRVGRAWSEHGFAEYYDVFNTNSLCTDELLEASCLTVEEMHNYFQFGKRMIKCEVGYALHISNLEIFDRPKELDEFRRWFKVFDEVNENTNVLPDYPITKAPQNMVYIEAEE